MSAATFLPVYFGRLDAGEDIVPMLAADFTFSLLWSTGGEARECGLLDKPAGTLPAPARACDGWLLANDGQLGYYRAIYGRDLLAKLLQVFFQFLIGPRRPDKCGAEGPPDPGQAQ